VFVFTVILSAALVAASPGLAALAILIYLAAATIFTGMVVELVADVQDGRRDAGARQLLARAMPVLGRLLLVAVVGAIGVFLGLVFFIVPGLILFTIWSVAAPVVVLERPPGLRALERSRELVRGNGLQVFGVLLILDILVLLAAGALELAAESGSTALGIVVRVIVGVLTAPLSALAASVLYFRLRAPSSGAAGL
jgi:hypothetical protein